MMMDQGNETIRPNYDPGSFSSFSKKPSIHTGIGGIMAQQEDLARTKQALASSPLKQDQSSVKRWINDKQMNDPKDFHPSVNESISSFKNLGKDGLSP